MRSLFDDLFGVGELLSDAPQLHAMVAHLPVALAMLGLPLILLALIFRERSAATRVLALAAYLVLAGAALWTVTTGEHASDLLPEALPAKVWEGVARHEDMAEYVAWLGALTSGLIGLGFVRAPRVRVVALVLAALSGAATLLWVGQTSRTGSVLVYRDGLGTPAVVIETRMYAAPAMTSTTESVRVSKNDVPSVIEQDAAQASLPAEVSYVQNVEPIFRDYCYSCHSGATPEVGLNLSTLEGAIRGAKSGPVVVPGDPANSLILKRLRGEIEPRMPENEPPLSRDRIALIEKWIAQGARESADVATAETLISREAPWQHQIGELLDDPSRVEAGDVRRDLRYALMASAPNISNEATAPLSRQERFSLFDEDGLRRTAREMRLGLLPAAPAPPPIEGIAHPVDAFIAGRLGEAGLEFPAESCTDEAFVRRVYLDVLGAIPSLTELRTFLGDDRTDKRERLIDALLDDTSNYAANWVPFWEDALCSTPNTVSNPQVFKKDMTFGEHGQYADWIFESFKKNRPFDLWVSELFDARMPGYQKDYVLRWDQTEVLQSAANAAQVFLGTSMKCASCHNHFSNPEWTQARFFQLASFFSADPLEVIRCEKRTGRYVSPKFVFDLPGMDLDAPAGLDARAARLGQLIVDPLNPRFAKTLVNRLWQRLLGEGLYEPVDDLRDDRQASHPELLEWLAQDFMRNGFDIKHTFRLILTSRSYQHPFRADRVEEFVPERPDAPRYFRSPHLRRLTAEQTLDSARKAVGRAWEGEARAYRAAELSPLQLALGRAATRNEVSTKRPSDPAVLQSLELMNGREFHALVYESPLVDSYARELKAGGAPGAIVDRVYLGVLGRRPAEGEARAAVDYLDQVQQAGASATEAVQSAVGDVFWALLVSPEFQYNH